MKFTVFGGSGFIGRNLVEYLERKGHEVRAPVRGEDEIIGADLGHVIYAIGLTGDFRTRPFDTVDAHVVKLTRLLRTSRFDSWLYLSSTRVYGRLAHESVAHEDTPLPVLPDADGLYDISKLMGEALCLGQNHPHIRVARLSNVYGIGQSRHTFLAAILAELKAAGKVIIREAPESAKDYVALADVLVLLEDIALSGRKRLYNVASGTSVSHAELAGKLRQLTGKVVEFEESAIRRTFVRIDVERVKAEFGFTPVSLLDDLNLLLDISDSTEQEQD